MCLAGIDEHTYCGAVSRNGKIRGSKTSAHLNGGFIVVMAHVRPNQVRGTVCTLHHTVSCLLLDWSDDCIWVCGWYTVGIGYGGCWGERHKSPSRGVIIVFTHS